MGLATMLKKLKAKEGEMRVLILGLDNAGKTTILRKFNGKDIDEIMPTLGFNIQTIHHDGYELNFWDVGGQKSLRTYWRNYFEATDGIIWVIDSTDRRRWEEGREELFKLLSEERLAGASVLIFANKQDLPGAFPVSEIAEQMKLDALSSHHYRVQGCSAVTGESLLEGIDWLVDDIARRIYMKD
ncbi:uncharacterized protein MONBRDRAFT_8937 [Monosiga brevicollis MX1]|uniref:ADP-ribosylation factor-like protein 2 n=1 Tax=Monosiga brevicollis TaxID=81824 RepID=A9V1K5_MONBE|nr:uncharacterized protein MONBRDRAFT_8937 [Monosiga brevicollis MX1]EDQ88456.1 predicted protein [Monosiga brevicollis MX1]|eukprot:XP_001746560.1 hypothetical protein [Monosiga brevicollis MX1]